MKRSITILMMVVVLVGNLAYGAIDAKYARKKPVANEPTTLPTTRPGSGNIISGGLSWFPVDSMANVYGMANSGIKCITYDPTSGALAIVHRASLDYGIASGQLWYNTSTDGGATWTRVGELNAGTPATLRYPSAYISNPTGSSNPADILFTWSAPRLVSGAFGGISYGLDQFNTGASFAVSGTDTSISSQTSIWGTAGSAYVYWASESGNTYRVWATNDFTTVSEQVPPTWADSPANFSNPLGYIHGSSTASASYFAVQALFPGDSADVINFGYSKSTDNAATWSGWTRPQPDWRRATGLPTSWDLMDFDQPAGGTVDYIGDFIVDPTDRAHFFNVVVDSPWSATDTRGILETYETGSGWESKWITMDLHEQTNLIYGGLPQTHQDLRASISDDGSVLACVWLDAGTASATDTIPDIWFSWRSNTPAGTWASPVNLSGTPTDAELVIHAGPRMRSNGGNSYTIFLVRNYESSNPPYPPNDVNKTTIYATSHTFTATTDVRNDGNVVGYKLAQNYPNPFNPGTKISFTLPERAAVKLSVYNVLGQEVATLVDGVRNAGVHDVGFSATNFPSGIYFYTLKAGQFSETRKMVLMK